MATLLIGTLAGWYLAIRVSYLSSTAALATPRGHSGHLTCFSGHVSWNPAAGLRFR
ncbi:hypothetical protein [Amycolatopsis acidicola]|uniref:hypothetical protein n=1 Tax=Amycolatopsis acidicola TaxID=2596893 RepID=UPI001FB6D2FD|nr:hypothetical protein [Amycolatopsis acidicola]